MKLPRDTCVVMVMVLLGFAYRRRIALPGGSQAAAELFVCAARKRSKTLLRNISASPQRLHSRLKTQSGPARHEWQASAKNVMSAALQHVWEGE